MPAPEGFSFSRAGSERVFVYHHERLAATLKGRAATAFLLRVERCDEHGAQLVMATLTGNYKRGNERAGPRR